jgi:hypothetical protein
VAFASHAASKAAEPLSPREVNNLPCVLLSLDFHPTKLYNVCIPNPVITPAHHLSPQNGTVKLASMICIQKKVSEAENIPEIYMSFKFSTDMCHTM